MFTPRLITTVLSAAVISGSLFGTSFAADAVPAAKPSAGPKAFIDGTGPGWKSLGEKNFAAGNSEADTWTFKNGAGLLP